MHKYQVDQTRALGVGGEGKVLEARKKKDGGEDEMFVMKQRLCMSLEDANNGLSEVCY